MSSKPEKKGRWRKILLGALLLVGIGVAVVVLNINSIALSQINKALNRYLVAGGKLEAVDIHLLEARVTLSGLHINPPPGFESHPLLALQVCEVDIAPWALFKGSVVVEELSMKGVSLNVVRDKNGRLSPLDLIVVKAPGKAALPEKEQEDTEPPWIPPIHVNTIHAEGLSFRLVDRLSKQEWSAGLGAELAIQGLRLEDLLKLDVLVERLDLKLNDIFVEQPPGFSSAPLLAMNQCELASQGIDLKSSRLSISDIILDKLSASLERNADREINLVKLMEAWLPTGEDDNDDASDPAVSTTAVDPPVPAFELPTLVVDNLQLTSVTAQVLDTIEGQPWRAGFDGLDIQVTGVEVGDLAEQAIALASFDLDIKGIAVDQPPGFSGNPLLAIGNIQMASSGIDLSTSRVSVSEVKLDTLSASLERNPDREINLVKLMEAWLPTGEDDNDDASDPAVSTTADDPPVPAFELPTLVVDNLQLTSVTAQVLDTIEGQPWRAGFDGLDIQVTGVEVGDLAEQAIALASLDLDLKGITIDQPSGFSETPLLSMGSFKLASQGIDLGASRATISDVILDGLSISVERNASDEVNLLNLKEAWLPASVEASGDKQDSSVSTTDASGSGFALPTVVVDNIELKSISAQLLASIENQLWRAGFDGLDIRVTGVEAGDPTEQAVSMASFDLDLKGIAVDQPPGFGTEKLFSLEQFTIISEKPDKTNKELVIKQVSLTGLTSYVAMHADGVSNLHVLNEALLGKREEPEASTAEPTGDRKASSPAPDLQPVLFEQISLDGGPVTYRDEFFAEETLVAALDNIHLEATDLRLFNKEEGVDPAPAEMSFELAQPGKLPTAYFGALATMGSLGYGVPMVNSQVRLVGLKLDTLGSLVPKTTRTALGASGLDGALALALDADAIDLNASVLTDHGIKYKGLKVKGPLEAAVVEPGPILTGVLSRVSDGLVNLGKGGLKSGVNIAEGGVEAVVELGSGAVEVGKNLGKSLFSATAGIVTLDKDKVKEGASGTTKGTVDITKGSVKGSGQAAGGSLKSSASELKGQNRVNAWEEGIPTRYQSTMQHAKKVLAEMPYPPVTK